MRHHEPLVAMRSKGRKPAGTVYLETDGFAKEWAEWRELDTADPRIHIEPTDSVARLDLFFLVGLPVSISGANQRRVREVFASAQDHGASRVIAHIVRPKGETFEIVEMLDTAGILTWTC